MTAGFEIVERAPTVEEYQMLRREVGWPEVETAVVGRGLAASLYSVCLLHDGEVVGCGRVVGDGGIYLYIQDIIVLPAYQRQGWGRRIMEAMMAYVASKAGRNTFVGLNAAEGVAPFYYRYGFAERPPGRPGMFRIWSGQESAEQTECLKAVEKPVETG
ncbi:MAG TPA: GNAT family N-acetyltransferase [Phycisphaerae bacterium]|nr:GNAT family N-acetyltransferase [Phycisphaerae bacterium]